MSGMNGRRRSGWVKAVHQPQPIVEYRLARVAPSVVEVGLKGRLREVRKRFPMRLGLGSLAQMGVRQTGGVDGEVVLGIGR